MSDLYLKVLTWWQTRDERGATAVEYGMIVALIAAIIVGTVAALGINVNQAFDTVNKGF